MTSRIPTKSGLYKYSRLTLNKTNYAKRMQRLSNGIFGELIREPTLKGKLAMQRLTKLPHDLDPTFVNYYPRHIETGLLVMKLREYGLFRDQHIDFKEEMREINRLKGKNVDKGKHKMIAKMQRLEKEAKEAKVIKDAKEAEEINKRREAREAKQSKKEEEAEKAKKAEKAKEVEEANKAIEALVVNEDKDA